MEDSENLSQVNERGSEAEKYQKVRVLGEGAMGKAYLVRSSEDELQYVMKRINIGHLPPKEREAALREAQLHSILQHPNIVQFKELYQTTGDKLCIIMEYA
jgi:NIMA (never in mitosis gene a)-related kinase